MNLNLGNGLGKTTKKKKRAKTAKKPDLLSQVIQLTGIPSKSIRKELVAILERKNIDPNAMTLDQLRGVVASYLREIMCGLLDRNRDRGQPN